MGLEISKAFIFLLCCSCCCSVLVISEAKNLKTFSKQYPSFNSTLLDASESNEGLLMQGNGSITSDALQLTTNDHLAKISNSSGRFLLTKRFKLWEEGSNVSSSRVASFNSSFLVNLFQVNNTQGEGLTFLIAPSLDSMPNHSYGQFLGLTNAATDGNPRNKIVAIELDTFKQDFDPDDNHIALDINGVHHESSVSLAPYNITLAPQDETTRFYNVWVEYNGEKKVIQVYIVEVKAIPDGRNTKPDDYIPPKPDSPIINSTLDLRQHLNQNSYFGFSASTGNNHGELNCVLRWNLTVEYYPDDGNRRPWVKIVVGVGVVAVVLFLLAGAAGVCRYYFHRKKMNTVFLGTLIRELPGNPKEFEFRELKKATDNFNDKRKLGEGGYGVVYRGFLANGNLEIAVKWFKRDSIKGQDDFLAELTIISRLRHKHLVRLLGWCHKNGKLLLVYEHMPKGSLDQHIFAGEDNKPPLDWNLRYKILSGVASALHYLHNEYDERVLHCDLKASNIMLDDNFNARLGDFGLARVLENEKTSYAAEGEGFAGTFGYIAPECFLTGKATQQSDVYAFGAVLLEVVCGHVSIH